MVDDLGDCSVCGVESTTPFFFHVGPRYFEIPLCDVHAPALAAFQNPRDWRERRELSELLGGLPRYGFEDLGHDERRWLSQVEIMDAIDAHRKGTRLKIARAIEVYELNPNPIGPIDVPLDQLDTE